MALKELLTDLTQGLNSYPNHNTPSTGGGFNYGSSTSVFDTKIFNQRSMGYSDKFTSQDNPKPLIPQILPGVNEGPDSSILFLEDSPDGFIRGGGTNSVIRTAIDSIRMDKFLLSPAGGAFINTQTHLQTTNPMIQEGGKGMGAALGTLGQFIFGTDLGFGVADEGTNRNFNINNILKQVQSNYLGIHYDRAGNKPIFEDEYKYFKQHSEGKRYDSDTVGTFSRSVGLEKGNRLLTLATKFHSGIDAVSAKARGSIMAQNNSWGIDLGDALDMFDSLTSGFKNLTNDPLGALGGKYTEDNVLFQYHGGPNSIYGAGDTILYRYDNTNFDSQNYWTTHTPQEGSVNSNFENFLHQTIASTVNSTLFGGLPIFGEEGLFFSDNSGKLIGDNFGSNLETFGRNVFGNDLVDLVTGQWDNPLLGGVNDFNVSINTEDPTSLLINGGQFNNFGAEGNITVKNQLTGPILSGHYLKVEGKTFLGPQTGYIKDANTDQIRQANGPGSITPTGQANIKKLNKQLYSETNLKGYWESHPHSTISNTFNVNSESGTKLTINDVYGKSFESHDKHYFTGAILSTAYLGAINVQTRGPQSGYISNPRSKYDDSVREILKGDEITPNALAQYKEDVNPIIHEVNSTRISKNINTQNQYKPSFKTMVEEGAKVYKDSNDHYLKSIPKEGFYRREKRITAGDPGATQHNWKDSYSKHDKNAEDSINMLDIHEVTDGDFTNAKYRDLARFRFEVVNSSSPNKTQVIAFRALIENFNDNYSANWNSHKYNGRAEEFYTYNSFKRGYSFDFKIAAQTRAEMKPLYRKLNYLASTLAPTYSAQTSRMKATYIKLSIGAYMDRTPGFLSSMTIKWSKEYPWEIALSMPENSTMTGDSDSTNRAKSNDSDMHVLPQVLDVSCQFTPIHDFTPKTSIECSPFIIPGQDSPLHTPTGEKRKWLKGDCKETQIIEDNIDEDYVVVDEEEQAGDQVNNEFINDMIDFSTNNPNLTNPTDNPFYVRDPLFDIKSDNTNLNNNSFGGW